jgi:transposase
MDNKGNPLPGEGAGRVVMETPEDVAAMLRLHALGWGTNRIAAELGASRNTVRRYVRQGGWQPYKKPERSRALEEHSAWLRERLLKHRGNADVVHQELEKEKGVSVSLRTVQREVEVFRQELAAEAKATVRFETRPGQQLQVDFGETFAVVGGERVKLYLCVLTLGYSRRRHASVWPCERQAQWLDGIERAIRHFGGVPEELLVDNPRALVTKHDPLTREVVFNPTFAAFCKHWGVVPRACAPYRARTKGKTERTVGYVKHNAIAGRSFESWSHLEAHLDAWLRDVADVRPNGTTGEPPIARFERDERAALRPIDGRSPFLMRRSLARRVQTDCCVEVDTNHYSVPLRFIGQEVTVEVAGEEVAVFHANEELARHPVISGKRQWRVLREHLAGIVRAESPVEAAPASSSLQRPLSVYEQVAGGAL